MTAYQMRKQPLGYNGDIFQKEDYEKILQEFPMIDSVMLGRGVLVNPGLLGTICGEEEVSIAVWKAFLERVCADYMELHQDPQRALHKMKELWCYIRFSFFESDIWNEKMKYVTSLEEYREIVEEFLEQYPTAPKSTFVGNYKQRGISVK